jgi:hypothetical protein
MKSIALVLLAALPLLGVLLLTVIGSGDSFAARYRRAREKTAAMSEAVDVKCEGIKAAVEGLDGRQRGLHDEPGE